MHAPSTRASGAQTEAKPIARRPAHLQGRHRLLWAILPLAAATAAAIAWWWPQAWMPASLLLIVYAMFTLLTAIDAGAHRRGGIARGGLLAAQERVALGTIGVVVAGLAAVSVVLAAAILESRLVAVGAFAVFILMLFIGLPFWAAAASEEAAAVREGREGASGSSA